MLVPHSGTLGLAAVNISCLDAEPDVVQMSDEQIERLIAVPYPRRVAALGGAAARRLNRQDLNAIPDNLLRNACLPIREPARTENGNGPLIDGGDGLDQGVAVTLAPSSANGNRYRQQRQHRGYR